MNAIQVLPKCQSELQFSLSPTTVYGILSSELVKNLCHHTAANSWCCGNYTQQLLKQQPTHRQNWSASNSKLHTALLHWVRESVTQSNHLFRNSSGLTLNRSCRGYLYLLTVSKSLICLLQSVRNSVFYVKFTVTRMFEFSWYICDCVKIVLRITKDSCTATENNKWNQTKSCG